MKNNLEALKIQTNVPEIITFKFPDFKTGTNDYGQWYKYTVENRGVDKVFFPTEYLHNMLQTIGTLEGKTLEILKYENGTFKNWKIFEAGLDITPKIIKNTPASTSTPRNNPLPVKQQTSPSISLDEFNELKGRIQLLEDAVFNPGGDLKF